MPNSNETRLNINQLHAAAIHGDRSDEDRLFAKLTESFRLLAQHKVWNRADAEEIVQVALSTILERYREIEFETSFSAWAYHVLENKLGDYYRAQKRRESRFEQIEIETPGMVNESSDPSLKLRLLDCLRKIGTANNRYARVLNLRYQGYTAEEICDRLELTRNNLYIILSRARASLKKCLKEGTID